jgi:hypothetical protein
MCKKSFQLKNFFLLGITAIAVKNKQKRKRKRKMSTGENKKQPTLRKHKNFTGELAVAAISVNASYEPFERGVGFTCRAAKNETDEERVDWISLSGGSGFWIHSNCYHRELNGVVLYGRTEFFIAISKFCFEE